METNPQQTMMQPSSSCPICGGTGYEIYEDENGYTFRRDCKCGAKERRDRLDRIRIANVPRIYENVTLKDIKASVYSTDEARKEIIKAGKGVRYWLDHLNEMLENGRGLYMTSHTKGTGKSMVAAAIANELIDKAIRVKFVTQNQIFEMIKNSWEDKQEGSEGMIIKNLQTVKILIIDEFGISKASDWANEKFYSIINSRYENKLITIFTSNITLNEAMKLNYDERIIDRIAGTCYLVKFPEESVRKNDMFDAQKLLGEIVKDGD